MVLSDKRVYIAVHKENPLEYFTFRNIQVDDTIGLAKVLKSEGGIKLWQIYTVKLGKQETEEGSAQYKLEISPYIYDEKKKLIKYLTLGLLKERRRFIRYRTIHLGIEVEGENFAGLLEDISASGLKIRVLELSDESKQLNELVKEGDFLTVKIKLPQQCYNVEILPVKVGDTFISAMFSGANPQNQELFQNVLSMLKEKQKQIYERRKFKRYDTSKLNLIADTPFGVGRVLDISLKGMKVKLEQKEENPPIDKDERFLTELKFLDEKEKFVITSKLVNKKENMLSINFTESETELYKLLAKVLEKLKNLQKV